MNRKDVLGTSLIIVLVSISGLLSITQNVKASDTIYIRADGSIEPITAKVFLANSDNVTYRIIRNIYDGIVVERSNITIDGLGYSVQGTKMGIGITLLTVYNVTIKNTRIAEFITGISLSHSLMCNITGNNITASEQDGIALWDFSKYNSISGNNITANQWDGIHLEHSQNNTILGNNIKASNDDGIGLVYGSNFNNISGNNITANDDYGIRLSKSSSNIICKNNVVNNDGIRLSQSSSNTITGNNITNNDWGIELYGSSGNCVYHNNLINNTYRGVYVGYSECNSMYGNNITDNGYGIELDEVSNGTIQGNTITNNSIGIWLAYSSDNSISGNNITANNDCGICLCRSSDLNNVSRNNIANNTAGIWISESVNNVHRNNSMADNRYNFGVEGDELLHFVQDVDTSNTISGRPIFYWVNKQNMEVPSDAGYVALINSSNITVCGLELKNNGQGMLLVITTDCNITSNYIANNKEGIRLHYSTDNSIYGNDFVNNTIQVESFNSVNVWNSSYPLGNYWSDYTDVDFYGGPYQNETGSDGIWDNSYIIDENNQDNYPIIPEFPAWTSMLLILMMLTVSIVIYKRRTIQEH